MLVAQWFTEFPDLSAFNLVAARYLAEGAKDYKTFRQAMKPVTFIERHGLQPVLTLAKRRVGM